MNKRLVPIVVLLAITIYPALTVRAVSNQGARLKVTYSSRSYAQVLAHVVHDGYIDYVRLKSHHMSDLNNYLQLISFVGPKTTPDQFSTNAAKLAYYINAYNATMIKRWIDAGAGDPQVLKTHPKVDEKTWFGQYVYCVDGKDVNLGQLEFEGVFGVSKDIRIHASLICGAQSCPPLHDVPYSSDADTLDAQLETAARNWMGESDGLFIDRQNRVWMSDVFRYYAKDFASIGGMAGLIERWMDDTDMRKPIALAAAKNKHVLYQKWNWTINQAGLDVDRTVDLTTEHYEPKKKSSTP
ncbi:MAG: DUF547 domain-containing protein [Phycisphaeraceae bacterium]|nr:DUF547 domain-containing protein [Phycisphaeraceae bacterium]